MKNKNVLISIGLVLLAVVVFFLGQSTKNQGKGFHKAFPKVLSSDVSEINLVNPKLENVLLKHNKELKFWMVKKDQDWLVADSAKLVKVFDYINDIKILQKVTKNKEKFEKFEITKEKAQKIIFKKKSGEPFKLLVGKVFKVWSVCKNKSKSLYLCGFR